MSLFPSGRSVLDHPLRRGKSSEYHIVTRMLDVGYNVLVPVDNYLRYDLVIEDADRQFWRVQCKTGRYKKGVIEFNTFSRDTRYDKYKEKPNKVGYVGQIDYFAVYCHELAKVYLVPASELPVGIPVLRVDPIKGSYKRGGSPIRWAADYEL